MDATNRPNCTGCPGRMVCHCLQITEEIVLDALASCDIQSVKDIRDLTGAGDGCTACHRLLRKYIQQQSALQMVQASSPSPI